MQICIINMMIFHLRKKTCSSRSLWPYWTAQPASRRLASTLKTFHELPEENIGHQENEMFLGVTGSEVSVGCRTPSASCRLPFYPFTIITFGSWAAAVFWLMSAVFRHSSSAREERLRRKRDRGRWSQDRNPSAWREEEKGNKSQRAQL